MNPLPSHQLPSHQLAPYFKQLRAYRTERGAAGKAFLIWLFGGGLGTAVVAYFIFRAMGC